MDLEQDLLFKVKKAAYNGRPLWAQKVIRCVEILYLEINSCEKGIVPLSCIFFKMTCTSFVKIQRVHYWKCEKRIVSSCISRHMSRLDWIQEINKYTNWSISSPSGLTLFFFFFFFLGGGGESGKKQHRCKKGGFPYM